MKFSVFKACFNALKEDNKDREELMKTDETTSTDEKLTDIMTLMLKL